MLRRDLVFKTPEFEERLRPVCEEVFKHFHLPKTRLLCFLDDQDQPAMTEKIGQFYCGVFPTIRGNALPFPQYLINHFIDYDLVPSKFRYDQFIYVRSTTCQTVPGAVITLAHELTHCRQRDAAFKVWLANSLLYWELYSWIRWPSLRQSLGTSRLNMKPSLIPDVLRLNCWVKTWSMPMPPARFKTTMIRTSGDSFRVWQGPPPTISWLQPSLGWIGIELECRT
jgi:hypothetical protein